VTEDLKKSIIISSSFLFSEKIKKHFRELSADVFFFINFLNKIDLLINFLVFNATFINISAILWRPVLVVEEAGVPGENHRPWASNWLTLSLAAASRVHLFCNLQS
jgi:hypothetical protein